MDNEILTRYEKLVQKRMPYLRRAQQCSALTVPSLIPPDNMQGQELPTPFQGTGARGVRTLASKLLLTLFPPSTTFFKITNTEKIKKTASPKDVQDLDGALAVMEFNVTAEMNKMFIRSAAFEVIRHLIVGGNGLMSFFGDKVKVFPLSQYVVARDCEGNPYDIIIKESLGFSTLPPEVQRAIQAKTSGKDSAAKLDEDVDIYTRALLTNRGGKAVWRVSQECMGVAIQASEGTYPEKKLPFLPLRWTRIDNEDYGRGLVEEYLGDLAGVDSLAKSLQELAEISAKCNYLVKPGGMTDKD